jgi:putative acetyltransferase
VKPVYRTPLVREIFLLGRIGSRQPPPTDCQCSTPTPVAPASKGQISYLSADEVSVVKARRLRSPGRLVVPIVRLETSADRAAIGHVHVASFPTAGEARLVDALRAKGRLSISLVAVDSDAIVGHVAFSPVTVSGVDGGVGLAPLAVLPAFRRRGLGAALIRQGLVSAEQAGFQFVVVLGEPTYYARFGFAPASRWGLRDEYGGGEAFQALEFRPAALPAGGGLVRYAPEFAAFDIPEHPATNDVPQSSQE